ncbi:acetyltransferase [Luteitalea sp. TBR-22]|uniref:GNAT family N-acetyltransferase n=1 Tax=Luteitalea sp. TBR-22 TaxID=2802971 RepID=UPI001AF861DE|nr:GNAT family N-acetyltransferase [Luteitalea sp. TBR-22]BCS35988.1 acetyltransferase [Luteitalea sp. TBR-22]
MAAPLHLLDALPIRTERLLLTRLDASHLPALAAMLADPIVMRFFPRVMTLDESQQWLRRTIDRYALHGTGLLAVLREDARGGDPEFLGDCGVLVRDFGGRTHLELGYHFARHAWGRGYATEAAAASLRLGFGATDAREIVALIRPENAPSQRVARRLAMHREGAVLHNGLVHDIWRIGRQEAGALALQ